MSKFAEEMKKNTELSRALVREAILQNPETAVEFFDAIVASLLLHKQTTDERNADIWLVVKNLKPEHLEEMKKLIIPEVFTRLGL